MELFCNVVFSAIHFANSVILLIFSILSNILGLFLENMATIEKLYGNDQYALSNDVETVLMKDYIFQNADENFDLTIRFCIGGAFRLLVGEKDPVRIQKTVELIEKALN